MKSKLPKNAETVLLALNENQETNVDGLMKKTKLSEKEVRAAVQELTEMGFINGPKSLQTAASEIVKELDPGIKETSSSYPYCIVVAASLIGEKAEDAYLSSQLSYDDEFISLVGTRLRNAGLWVNGQFSEPHKEALMSEGGGISFFLYVNVAEGSMTMSGPADNPQFQLTDTGLKQGAALLKKASGA